LWISQDIQFGFKKLRLLYNQKLLSESEYFNRKEQLKIQKNALKDKPQKVVQQFPKFNSKVFWFYCAETVEKADTQYKVSSRSKNILNTIIFDDPFADGDVADLRETFNYIPFSEADSEKLETYFQNGKLYCKIGSEKGDKIINIKKRIQIENGVKKKL